MTQQEILEGNRLIAEFMGATIDVEYKDKLTYRYPENSAPKEYASFVWSLDGMQYHTSWDWLMPIIYKLKTYDVKEDLESEDYNDAFMRNYEEVIFALATLNIETTWSKVVGLITLINYYENLNQQPQK